jgi:nitronate monooxygenase
MPGEDSSRHSWKQTRISQKLGIEHPILQGPLGGFPTQRLAAIVSNFGGLGSYGAHGLAPSAIRDVIAEIRRLTGKPFAMNLWVSMQDEGAFASSPQDFDRSLAPLVGHLNRLGAPRPSFTPYSPIKFEDQAREIIDANVPVFSFIFGIPPQEILAECRRKGIVTVGGATTPDEAVALEQAGVDAVVASGFEAGGHRGSFLRSSEDSLTGTFSLVPRVADAVSIPVIAAGGISDGRGAVAAFALGAEAVQLGTAFLACDESGASQIHRDALLSGRAANTVLTRAVTGRLARGIRNQIMEELNRPEVEVLPYPLQRTLFRSLSAPAEKAGREDLLSLWAGQSASLTRHRHAAQVLEALVSDIASIAGEVIAWTHARASRTQ